MDGNVHTPVAKFGSRPFLWTVFLNLTCIADSVWVGWSCLWASRRVKGYTEGLTCVSGSNVLVQQVVQTSLGGHQSDAALARWSHLRAKKLLFIMLFKILQVCQLLSRSLHIPKSIAICIVSTMMNNLSNFLKQEKGFSGDLRTWLN